MTSIVLPYNPAAMSAPCRCNLPGPMHTVAAHSKIAAFYGAAPSAPVIDSGRR